MKSTKKVLVINGHPTPSSFNDAIAEEAIKKAKAAGATVNSLTLRDLDFDLILHYGFDIEKQELEEDLKKATALILDADELVWVYPMWWANMPALVKGFIDRVFLPGTTFKYQKGKSLPDKLLKGKSARVYITTETPSWYYNLFMRRAASVQMKRGVLGFCGVSPVKIKTLGPIRPMSEQQRHKILASIV